MPKTGITMRNKFFLISAAAVWAANSGGVYAQNIGDEQIPKPVLEKFQQRHPDAKEMHAESVTHFRTPLVKIGFKKGDDREIEYFRPNGAFFVNGFSVNEDEIPLEFRQNLKTEFSDYRLETVTLIVNPNGVGREYEVDVSAAGNDWEFIADESGAILGKMQE
jgi:hypothetical protein